MIIKARADQATVVFLCPYKLSPWYTAYHQNPLDIYEGEVWEANA